MQRCISQGEVRLCVKNYTTSHDCYSLTVPAYVKNNTCFPDPVSLLTPQIPYVPALHRTLTSVARSQLLTAPATTRPIMKFIRRIRESREKCLFASPCLSVCPSVCTFQLGLCWRAFSWNLLTENFTKDCWVFLPTTRNWRQIIVNTTIQRTLIIAVNMYVVYSDTGAKIQ